MSNQQTNPTISSTPPPLAPSGSAPLASTLDTTPTQPTPATTPSPDKIAAAANAAPKLEPAATIGIADSSSTAQEAAVRAQVANAFKTASQMNKLLGQQDVDFQGVFWKKASPSLKSLLTAAGYSPPSAADLAPSGGGAGFWHDVAHYADDARHAGGQAMSALNKFGLKPVEDVFSAAVAPVNQLTRAAFENSQEAGPSWSLENVLHTLNPVDILRDYNSVANGSTSFQPDALKYVQREMGISGQTLKLAMSMASGTGLQGALNSVPTKERASAYALIESTPRFQEAVQLLADSHLTLGQMVFGGLSPAQEKQLYPGQSLGALQVSALGAQAVGAVGSAAAIAEGNPEGASGALSDLVTGGGMSLRTATGLAVGGAMGVGAAQGALTGQTADAATRISPFGISVNPLSGMLDGLVSWYSNPLFVGLQARTAYTAAEHSLATVDAMGNARDVLAYYQSNPSGQRLAQFLADKLTTPWADGDSTVATSPNFQAAADAGLKFGGLEPDIQDAYPAIRAAVESGNTAAVNSVVGEMFAKPQAIVKIFRGQAGMLFKDATQFPHMTLTQKMLEDIKGIGRSALSGRRFSPAKLSPRELMTEAFGEPEAEMGMRAAAETPNPGIPARFMRRATNIVPTHNYLVLDDPQIGTQIERFARYSLTDDQVAVARNGFFAIPAEQTGARRAFLLGVIQDVLHDAGVENTADGQKWLEDYLGRQRYSYIGNAEYVNPLDPTGPTLSHALLDTQLANAVGLPDFRELYKFSRKSWFMSALQSGLNNDLFDRFMGVFWKRALLLRPGFALRVAGEETLNYMMRNGPRAYAEGRIAASLYDTANTTRELRAQAVANAAKAAMGDVKAVNDADVGALYHAMASDLPEEIRATIKTPEELKASIQGFSAINWARRIGLAVVPKQILDGAYELAKRGVLDSAFEDYIDMITQHGSTYLGDVARSDPESLWHLEDGTPISITNTGRFKSYQREDSEALPAWSYRLSGIARSGMARSIARAFRDGGRDAQVQAALDWIDGTNLTDELATATEGGDEGAINDAQAALDDHQALLRKFATYYQTKDGRTVASGAATQAEANRDWAEAAVNEVNNLTMTSEGQTFDDAGERIPVNSPQPIILGSSVPARTPWKLGTRDVDREITPSNVEMAYRGIRPGYVRLFRAENTTSAEVGADRMMLSGSRLPNPGRTWFATFDEASSRAGEDGEVYQITVPVADLSEHYDYHGTNFDAAQLSSLQRSGHVPSHPAGVDGYFESGRIVHSNATDKMPDLLIDNIGKGVVPGNDELARIDRVHMPDEIAAPEMVLRVEGGSATNRIMEKGMRQVVGRPANWLSRQPIFTRNYAVSLAETKAMLEARGIEDEDGSLAHDVAMERAFNETIPYIHNPRLRSQFSVITRNLMPFWFAQEQFYKRWARLFGTYPEAWYKLSQTMNGLRSVGFVQKDSYGQDSFVYPGSQAVLSLLTKLPFFGSIPVGVSMTGEISQLNPTLTTGGAPWPSFGPFVSIPMTLVGVIFPKAETFSQAALGPDAPPIDEQGGWVNQIFDQLMPSVVNRSIQWLDSPSGGSAGHPGEGAVNVASPLYMSSMIAAAQQMEASGHGLTAAQLEAPNAGTLVAQYLDRLSNWTTNLLLLRTMFGFLSPATPTFEFNDNGVGAQFSALLATMPYDQAVTAFLGAHPNATADTVFASTTSPKSEPLQGSGTYVPATTRAAHFINSNLGFFTEYPQLAPWAIPVSAQKGLFNGTTYDEENGLDLRVRRSLTAWYNEVKYAEGANVYYPLEQLVLAAKSPTNATSVEAQTTLGLTQAQAQARIGMTGASEAQITQKWDDWATKFKTTHPLFASQLGDPTSTNRRNAIVQSLVKAISAGALPKTEWSTRMEEMMSAFDKVTTFYNETRGDSAYATQRTQNKEAFIAWGNAFANAYPVVSQFWQGVLMKQVPG